MGLYFAVCNRSAPSMGRDMSLTYSNVVQRPQSTSGTLADITSHPTWSDPLGNEFAVVLTSEQYDQLQTQTHHSNMANLPLWQVRDASNGQTSPAFGSFDDPTDTSSTFVEDRLVPDPRHVLRFYDADPDAGGSMLTSLQTHEETQTPLLVYVRFFDQGDVPLTFSQTDLLLDLGGNQLLVDVVDGQATFNVSLAARKTITLAGDSGYRIVTGDGVGSMSWRVVSRSLG